MRKTVAVDAAFLAVLLDERARTSIQTLVDRLSAANAKVIIPTPALAPVLTNAPNVGARHLEHIRRCACFQIRPFDDKASIELVQILGQNSSDRRELLKFERQIVAIAKVYGASTLYADDEQVVAFAAQCRLPVVRLKDL